MVPEVLLNVTAPVAALATRTEICWVSDAMFVYVIDPLVPLAPHDTDTRWLPTVSRALFP